MNCQFTSIIIIDPDSSGGSSPEKLGVQCSEAQLWSSRLPSLSGLQFSISVVLVSKKRVLKSLVHTPHWRLYIHSRRERRGEATIFAENGD